MAAALLLSITPSGLTGAERRISASEFAAQALPQSPVEEPRAFRIAIEQWTEPNRRDPAARPSGGQAILEMEDLRLKLAKSGNQAGRAKLLDRIVTILKDELERTRAARETQPRDSRLGYDWEKISQIRNVLEQEIPAYRRQHGLSRRPG